MDQCNRARHGSKANKGSTPEQANTYASPTFTNKKKCQDELTDQRLMLEEGTIYQLEQTQATHV
jgi:hypothetical protein